jgi:hypothetical protein
MGTTESVCVALFVNVCIPRNRGVGPQRLLSVTQERIARDPCSDDCGGWAEEKF